MLKRAAEWVNVTRRSLGDNINFYDQKLQWMLEKDYYLTGPTVNENTINFACPRAQLDVQHSTRSYFPEQPYKYSGVSVYQHALPNRTSRLSVCRQHIYDMESTLYNTKKCGLARLFLAAQYHTHNACMSLTARELHAVLGPTVWA